MIGFDIFVGQTGRDFSYIMTNETRIGGTYNKTSRLLLGIFSSEEDVVIGQTKNKIMFDVLPTRTLLRGVGSSFFFVFLHWCFAPRNP